MACTKWIVFLGFVVMLAACGGDDDLVVETSFDTSAEESVGGDDSSSSSKAKSSSSKGTSSAEETASSSSESAVENKGKTISGVAQKGPFLAQSVVKIYELNPKTLAKTGRVFSGEVGSDGDGSFKVPNVELSSPYVLVEARGRFRNEVTGETSGNEITLRAVVNLEGRDEVNVNLLTHLTYERILYLVGTGVDFAAAKKKAESEILKAFYIEDKFENFEDMNIFGDSEDGGALLAISALVIGYYDDAQLAKFLEVFAADFKKDGTWDDETTRYYAKYSWASEVDVSIIRKNIADWKIGPVPNFRKFIREFSCGFYGNSKCYEVCSVDSSIVKSGSSWKVCLEGMWVGLDAMGVDTFGWEAGEDGELRKGDSTGRFYKYDEVLKLWDNVEWDDTTFKLGCTYKRLGEIILNPKDNIYYVCKDLKDYDMDCCNRREWDKAREIDFIKRDNKCDSENIGRIVAGTDTVTNKYYCTTNGWVDLMGWSFDVPKEFRFNPDIDYGTMTDKRDGKTYRTTKIGDQVWMAENLNYAGNGGIGHCYDDIPENCETGGRLYKWNVAKDVCPEGWHLPSKTEFETMFSTVKLIYDKEMGSFADMFKATSGWKSANRRLTQGLDKVGFSAVPAGGRYIGSYREPLYNDANYSAYFLTSTERNEVSEYIMLLRTNEASIVYDFDEGRPRNSTKESSFSVRCLKDE